MTALGIRETFNELIGDGQVTQSSMSAKRCDVHAKVEGITGWPSVARVGSEGKGRLVESEIETGSTGKPEGSDPIFFQTC